MAFAAGSTCWACRSTQARFCASCVLQAMSERALRLQEIESERARLEKVMVEGLRRRQRAVQLQEARREHAAEMSRLSAELEEVRGETERRAVEVNELRRQRLAETSAPPPSSAASPAPTFAAAATAQRLSDVRRQLLRELLELYHLHWAPEALQRGGGAEAADNDASPPPATQSEVLGAALGQLVLLVRLAARHLSLAPLPFDTEFRGSDSLIWHRGQHRALRLQPPHQPDARRDAEWRQATAMLAANAHFLLAHFGAPPAALVRGAHAADAPHAVLEPIAQLLRQPSLAWEFLPPRAPWRPPAAVLECDGHVEDWALVEPPAVPTPSATDDDVSAWEQSVCAPRAATPPRADVEVEVEAPPVDVATPGWWTRREWQL
jgi:hypothetical protein